MNNLYVFDHPIGFPQSEYGGLWVVAADTKEIAADLIVEQLQGDIDDAAGFFGEQEERKSNPDVIKEENLVRKYLIKIARVIGFTKDSRNAIIERFIT